MFVAEQLEGMALHSTVGMRLATAIQNDNEEAIKTLLDEITNPEELNDDLNIYDHIKSPLGQACYMDKPDLVDALLQKGADPNLKYGRLRQCAMQHAAEDERGHVRCVELLLQYGADLNAQDSDKVTALHNVCTMENVELFDFLLANGANLNILDVDSETPLIRAILARNPYMIKGLITAGCDVNYPNGDPLEYLLRAVPPIMDCIHTFIEHGVNLDKSTYMNTACASNNIEMMKILKSHGVSVNSTSFIFNFTPLHQGCVSLVATHTVVELLLEWGAYVDPVSSTNDTPLHYASQQCNLRKVLALLDYSPDVNRLDSGSMTPLAALLTTRFPDDLKEDYFKLGKLLIASGTRLSIGDIKLFEKEIPVALSSVQTEQEIYDFLQQLKDFVDKPTTLQNLCRQKIRASIREKIGEQVQMLTLPRFLKNFLLFSDII